MDKLKKVLDWLVDQSTVTKILVIIAALCVAVGTVFFGSCSVAKSSVSGDRVVDKNVRDSTHYEVVVEK